MRHWFWNLFKPKIHKGKYPPPGRPVVSANECPTGKISKLVDFFLNPLVQQGRSYLQDTTHLLRLLEVIGLLPPNSILVTLYVSSLYTNIPQTGGLQALMETLQQGRSQTANLSNASLVQMMRYVLERNNFQFYGQNYLLLGARQWELKELPAAPTTTWANTRTNTSASTHYSHSSINATLTTSSSSGHTGTLNYPTSSPIWTTVNLVSSSQTRRAKLAFLS